MSKEKKIPVSYRRRIAKQLLKIVVGLIWLFLCGLFSCTVLFLAYMSVGLIQPSLDAALLPTAQYLLEHPQPTPEGMTITLRYETSSLHSKVCYSYTQEREVYGSFWPTLYLNGAMVPRNESFFSCHSNLLTRENRYQSGIDASKLDAGLHLLELHLRQNPWDTPLIYQGALLIED